MARDAIELANDPFLLRLVNKAMKVSVVDVEWFSSASCLIDHQHERERWYPDRSTPKTTIEETRRICRRCPVRGECLGWALGVGDWHGIWGGFTADERRAIARQWKVMVS